MNTTIVINETAYAKERLDRNDIGENPYYTLTTIAKHYYWNCGYRKKKIAGLLIDFLRKSYPKYEMNENDWKITAEKIAAKAKNSRPSEISGVKITKSEMQKIGAIQNKGLERLMFVMLCAAKANNLKNDRNKGWVNVGAKELFKYAGISCGATERDVKIGQLWQMGYLEFSQRNDNLNCRVTIIDDDSEEELFVWDFRQLGYEYRLYRGENFIRCSECGMLTKANKAGTKKYCKDCAVYTPRRMKTITCVDCGNEFDVDAKNNRTCRCAACYTRYRANQKLETQRLRREIS